MPNARGGRFDAFVREEDGVLPIVLEGDINAYWQRLGGRGRPYRASCRIDPPGHGLLLPDAVRLADHIARAPIRRTEEALRTIERYAKQQWRRHSFYRTLNRMLFRRRPRRSGILS